MKTLALFLFATVLTAAAQDVKPPEDIKQLQTKVAELEAENHKLTAAYIDLLKDYTQLLVANAKPGPAIVGPAVVPKRLNFLQGMGAAMQQQASQPKTNVNCTSRTWGNTTYTDCN